MFNDITTPNSCAPVKKKFKINKNLPRRKSKKPLNKIHKCSKCGRGFTHVNNLYLHTKFVCGKDPQFFCQFCDYRAKIKGNLTKHLRNAHGII